MLPYQVWGIGKGGEIRGNARIDVRVDGTKNGQYFGTLAVVSGAQKCAVEGTVDEICHCIIGGGLVVGW